MESSSVDLQTLISGLVAVILGYLFGKKGPSSQK